MLLYRPVGASELAKIEATGFQGFPPRFETQPIFYPVLNEGYAVQIAKEWNTRDQASGYVGYVTRFEVEDVYVSKFERQVVGNQSHEELWVPSEELEEFNSHIVGRIEVVKAYHSIQFMKKHSTENAELEWDEFVNRLSETQFSREDCIPGHEHCNRCPGVLAENAINLTGTEWNFGYIGHHCEGFYWCLCPPCFDVLNENFELIP